MEFCLVSLTSSCLFCIMANYRSVRFNISSVRPCSSELKETKTNKYIPIFWHFTLVSVFYYCVLFRKKHWKAYVFHSVTAGFEFFFALKRIIL